MTSATAQTGLLPSAGRRGGSSSSFGDGSSAVSAGCDNNGGSRASDIERRFRACAQLEKEFEEFSLAVLARSASTTAAQSAGSRSTGDVGCAAAAAAAAVAGAACSSSPAADGSGSSTLAAPEAAAAAVAAAAALDASNGCSKASAAGCSSGGPPLGSQPLMPLLADDARPPLSSRVEASPAAAATAAERSLDWMRVVVAALEHAAQLLAENAQLRWRCECLEGAKDMLEARLNFLLRADVPYQQHLDGIAAVAAASSSTSAAAGGGGGRSYSMTATTSAGGYKLGRSSSAQLPPSWHSILMAAGRSSFSGSGQLELAAAVAAAAGGFGSPPTTLSRLSSSLESLDRQSVTGSTSGVGGGGSGSAAGGLVTTAAAGAAGMTRKESLDKTSATEKAPPDKGKLKGTLEKMRSKLKGTPSSPSSWVRRHSNQPVKENGVYLGPEETSPALPASKSTSSKSLSDRGSGVFEEPRTSPAPVRAGDRTSPQVLQMSVGTAASSATGTAAAATPTTTACGIEQSVSPSVVLTTPSPGSGSTSSPRILPSASLTDVAGDGGAARQLSSSASELLGDAGASPSTPEATAKPTTVEMRRRKMGISDSRLAPVVPSVTSSLSSAASEATPSESVVAVAAGQTATLLAKSASGSQVSAKELLQPATLTYGRGQRSASDEVCASSRTASLRRDADAAAAAACHSASYPHLHDGGSGGSGDGATGGAGEGGRVGIGSGAAGEKTTRSSGGSEDSSPNPGRSRASSDCLATNGAPYFSDGSKPCGGGDDRLFAGAAAGGQDKTEKGKDKGKASRGRFAQRVKRELEKRLSRSKERGASRSKSCERADVSDDFAEKLRDWSVKQGYAPDYYGNVAAERAQTGRRGSHQPPVDEHHQQQQQRLHQQPQQVQQQRTRKGADHGVVQHGAKGHQPPSSAAHPPTSSSVLSSHAQAHLHVSDVSRAPHGHSGSPPAHAHQHQQMQQRRGSGDENGRHRNRRRRNSHDASTAAANSNADRTPKSAAAEEGASKETETIILHSTHPTSSSVAGSLASASITLSGHAGTSAPGNAAAAPHASGNRLSAQNQLQQQPFASGSSAHDTVLPAQPDAQRSEHTAERSSIGRALAAAPLLSVTATLAAHDAGSRNAAAAGADTPSAASSGGQSHRSLLSSASACASVTPVTNSSSIAPVAPPAHRRQSSGSAPVVGAVAAHQAAAAYPAPSDQPGHVHREGSSSGAMQPHAAHRQQHPEPITSAFSDTAASAVATAHTVSSRRDSETRRSQAQSGLPSAATLSLTSTPATVAQQLLNSPTATAVVAQRSAPVTGTVSRDAALIGVDSPRHSREAALPEQQQQRRQRQSQKQDRVSDGKDGVRQSSSIAFANSIPKAIPAATSVAITTMAECSTSIAGFTPCRASSSIVAVSDSTLVAVASSSLLAPVGSDRVPVIVTVASDADRSSAAVAPTSSSVSLVVRGAAATASASAADESSDARTAVHDRAELPIRGDCELQGEGERRGDSVAPRARAGSGSRQPASRANQVLPEDKPIRASNSGRERTDGQFARFDGNAAAGCRAAFAPAAPSSSSSPVAASTCSAESVKTSPLKAACVDEPPAVAKSGAAPAAVSALPSAAVAPTLQSCLGPKDGANGVVARKVSSGSASQCGVTNGSPTAQRHSERRSGTNSPTLRILTSTRASLAKEDSSFLELDAAVGMTMSGISNAFRSSVGGRSPLGSSSSHDGGDDASPAAAATSAAPRQASYSRPSLTSIRRRALDSGGSSQSPLASSDDEQPASTPITLSRASAAVSQATRECETPPPASNPAASEPAWAATTTPPPAPVRESLSDRLRALAAEYSSCSGGNDNRPSGGGSGGREQRQRTPPQPANRSRSGTPVQSARKASGSPAAALGESTAPAVAAVKPLDRKSSGAIGGAASAAATATTNRPRSSAGGGHATADSCGATAAAVAAAASAAAAVATPPSAAVAAEAAATTAARTVIRSLSSQSSLGGYESGSGAVDCFPLPRPRRLSSEGDGAAHVLKAVSGGLAAAALCFAGAPAAARAMLSTSLEALPAATAAVAGSAVAGGRSSRDDRRVAVQQMVSQFEKQPHASAVGSSGRHVVAQPVAGKPVKSPMTKLKTAAELMTISTGRKDRDPKPDRHQATNATSLSRGATN